MKKLLLASLVATLALTACSKQEPAPAETKTETTETKAETHDHKHEHDDKHDHDHDDKHEHGHDHKHDHAGHDHHHHEGDVYQCGDKTATIVVHDHEGEIEAHFTMDDITYDLEQDPNSTERYVTDNGIEDKGKDKGMALIISKSEGKAQLNRLNGSLIMDCKKQS